MSDIAARFIADNLFTIYDSTIYGFYGQPMSIGAAGLSTVTQNRDNSGDANGVVRSMTENEIAAIVKENESLRAELAETRELSNQYLQNVAHQLTAPLGAIKWSIEALKDPRVPITRKSNLLSSIYNQATILVHLIKNFALMSNLETDLELGQFREKPEPIDMMKLSINLANDFQPQASDIGLKIVVDESSFCNPPQFRTSHK